MKLIVDKELLLRGIDDPEAHQSLLDNWRNVFSACRPETWKKGPVPVPVCTLQFISDVDQ